MRQHLADAIKQLAPELRQVCLLRDVLQYSTQETAERVGISAMAVRLRLFRAHRRLRERLSLALQPKKERQAHASWRKSVRAKRPKARAENSARRVCRMRVRGLKEQ